MSPGRKPNKVRTVTVTISTTPAIVRYLERFVEKELYGKTPAEVAERMLLERIRELEREGALERGATRGPGQNRRK